MSNGDSNTKIIENSKSQYVEINLLVKLEHIIFNLTEENLNLSIEQTMKLLDPKFPYSCNLTICALVYHAFCSKINVNDLYLRYLELIQTKEEIQKIDPKILTVFKIQTFKPYYLIEKMISQNLIDKNITKNIFSPYFAHYKTERREIIKKNYYHPLYGSFFKNYDKLSKNNWELHKKYVREGHNPNEIAKIIRNDEIEKLQEISTQTNYDFNQTIEPSLYEICSLVNQKNVSLIYYAAFFSSVKCFKYLLMNNSKVEKTGKYAVAGGNEEIIHLCEQNHSSFEGSYETAIEFHKNEIFKYLYENKTQKIDSLEKLGRKCIFYHNYEIFAFLLKEGIDINAKNYIYFNNLIFQNNIWKLFQLFKTALILASSNGHSEIVKLLRGKELIEWFRPIIVTKNSEVKLRILLNVHSCYFLFFDSGEL